MYKLYFIMSESTEYFYIGMTSTSLEQRFASHKHSAKRGNKTPLYDAMRKYSDFQIIVYEEFATREECAKAEIQAIQEAKDRGYPLLNLAKGGNGGFVIPEDKIEDWKAKLSESRKGRKPFLGHNHSEEVKKKCKEASIAYWKTQDTYDAEKVTSIPFREAKKLYGISKTHYYRLRKRLAERSDC